ncbi:5258_t:CDS:2, partial [Paraglomus brasilianum]
MPNFTLRSLWCQKLFLIEEDIQLLESNVPTPSQPGYQNILTRMLIMLQALKWSIEVNIHDDTEDTALEYQNESMKRIEMLMSESFAADFFNLDLRLSHSAIESKGPQPRKSTSVGETRNGMGYEIISDVSESKLEKW